MSVEEINSQAFEQAKAKGAFDKLPPGSLVTFSEGKQVFTSETGDLERAGQFIIVQGSASSFLTKRIE